jgi:hypothetical protein
MLGDSTAREDVLVKHVQHRYVDPTGEIQRLLRLLTHRQMRELCQKLANGKDTIASLELADALSSCESSGECAAGRRHTSRSSPMVRAVLR